VGEGVTAAGGGVAVVRSRAMGRHEITLGRFPQLTAALRRLNVCAAKGVSHAPRPLAQLTATLRQWIFARSCAMGRLETAPAAEPSAGSAIGECSNRSIPRNGR
jgi:hypothetical protein